MRRPAFVRTVVCLVALLLGAASLRWQQAAAVRLHAVTPGATRTLNTAPGDRLTISPLGVIAAYTAASITAAQTGQVTLLAPYLVPDSPLWVRIAAEYARRAAAGETHQPTLARWGLVEQTATETRATVELQEQWDDVRLVRGQPPVTRTGIVQRIRYDLQRPAATDRWQIAAIEVQVILPGTTR